MEGRDTRSAGRGGPARRGHSEHKRDILESSLKSCVCLSFLLFCFKTAIRNSLFL